MVKVYYTFGERISRAACDGDWDEVAGLHENGDGNVCCREFETAAEANAYCMGVADGNGWADAYYLTDDEVENVVKLIGKENIKEPSEL